MSDKTKELLWAMVTELIKQAPAVAVLIVILVHQQYQINLLLEKCIIISQAMP